MTADSFGVFVSTHNHGSSIPADEGADATLDLLVADQIAKNMRFQTLDVTAAGIARENYSARSTNSRAAAEASNDLDRLWEALQSLLPPAPTRGRR